MGRSLNLLFGYIVTGGFAAVIDLSLFGLLASAHWPTVAAASTSFSVALLANYVLSSIFVFRCPLSWRTFLRFVTAAVMGFCINVTITWIGADMLSFSPLVAKTCGIGIALGFNFLASKHWAFR